MGLRRQNRERRMDLAAWGQSEGARVWCAIIKGVWKEDWVHQQGAIVEGHERRLVCLP